MNDLDAVAVAEDDLRPVGPPDDFPVKLDGQPLRGQRELHGQLLQRQRFDYFTRFAVDLYPQSSRSLSGSLSLVDHPAQLVFMPVLADAQENRRPPGREIRQLRLEGGDAVLRRLDRKNQRPETRPQDLQRDRRIGDWLPALRSPPDAHL